VSLKNILHQKVKQKQNKNDNAGPTTKMTTMSEHHLILRAMAGGVGISHARIWGGSSGWGHGKVHQNLGHIPHQDHQPSGLGDVVCLRILKEPLEFYQLHQLVVIISGVKSCSPPSSSTFFSSSILWLPATGALPSSRMHPVLACHRCDPARGQPTTGAIVPRALPMIIIMRHLSSKKV
jgi:hypothetical protein